MEVGSLILDEAPTTTRAEYTFVGWALDDGGVSMVDAEDVVTAADTIYAIWEAVVE